MFKKIAIIDFGGQYSHLISSRIRRMGVLTEIIPNEVNPVKLTQFSGIILSGGPESVYEKNSPKINPKIFDLNIPILGICYGHQLMMKILGGEVKQTKKAEYGPANLEIIQSNSPLFQSVPKRSIVWMSHSDEVDRLPKNFDCIGTSENCKFSATMNVGKKLFSVQFHPEVTHSQFGNKILENFMDVCLIPKTWNMKTFYKQKIEILKNEIPKNKKIFMLISGGVDSTVAFVLLSKILDKKNLIGCFIDTGFMRKNETESIQQIFDQLNIKILIRDASEEFIKNLKKAKLPEEKRKITGATFLEIQKTIADQLKLNPKDWILGQGTIYPDTIESGSTKHSQKIKTHHNRVDEIEKLIREGKIIEPLKELYKDEVRELGKILKIDNTILERHPFPGPGLIVRMICSRNKSKLKKSDLIILENLKKEIKKLEYQLLPIASVGVKGDRRSYENCILINHFSKDWQTLEKISLRIVNELNQVNRVVFQPFQKTLPGELIYSPIKLDKVTTDILREADYLVDKIMRNSGMYNDIWQFPVVLLPIGEKKGKYSVILRPVHSEEAMTASFFKIEERILKKIVHSILKISGISFVFYDLTNKPPGTIEWE